MAPITCGKFHCSSNLSDISFHSVSFFGALRYVFNPLSAVVHYSVHIIYVSILPLVTIVNMRKNSSFAEQF